MSEAQHDLAHEFPEHKERIHELKTSDEHFAGLAEQYHELVKELHQIEAGVETPADDYVEELKKKRLAVMDEIASILKQAD
ncbi:MAG: DUF465 domain-containing protein [Myxococcales bacterium]|jgi:uncharacterized protein YdcH (DUF465 family)